MKVVIFSNIPAPYFVEYLNELGKKADVKAYFEREKASNRDKSWKNINARDFTYEFLGGINVTEETAFSIKVISAIKKNEDRIIIFANPTTLTGIIGVNYCKKNGLPYILQSEGGFAHQGNFIKEYIKKKLIPGATLYLTGMNPKTDYFTAYGAPIERVKQYPYASIYREDMLGKCVSDNEKKAIRQTLNIKYDKVILYVGSMIYRKGIDILIKACENIGNNIGIYLVGGKSNAEYDSLIKDYNIENIHFISHTSFNELKDYYKSADVFILPTRMDTWGLVINEAMSFGLPIITTDACVAGQQLIENGVNGYVISKEDTLALHEKIVFLIENDNIRSQMSQNNIEKIKSHNYEDMAESIYQYLCDNHR